MSFKNNFTPTIVQELLAKIFLTTGGAFLIIAFVFFLLTNMLIGNIVVNSVLAVTFMFVGGSFFITGFILRAYVIKQEKRALELMKNGSLIKARIIDYRYNYAVRLNRRTPVKFTCQWEDERYISENYWGNPEEMIGTEVNVYLDSKNYNNYYVSIN